MSAVVETDILVVGLGPAGASAAAAAADGGARVLAVERNAQAGQPVQCAEFVPMMIGGEAPQMGEASVQAIDRMLTYVNSDRADLTPDFRGHMIDRARFDRRLVEAAEAAGATCRFATRLRSISDLGVAHFANGEAVRSKVIIGADGPRSPVGNAAGCPNRHLVETRQITTDLLVAHNGTDIFLNPDITGGYGWLFPKGDVCNVGLGVVAAEKHRLKPLLEDLHARLVAEGRVGRKIHAHTGGAIPVGGIAGLHGRIGQADILLCGDAAGLTNPITGAGINAAVISGRLAGEAAAALIAGDTEAIADYSDEIIALFGRSLALASKRRRQLLAACASAGPTDRQLRNHWIAYPEYWTDSENIGTMDTKETRVTA